MLSTTRTNILSITMLTLHSLWLLSKIFWGIEEHQNNAVNLLSFTIPMGILVIFWPYVKLKLPFDSDQIFNSLKKLWQEKHPLFVALIFLAILLIDLVFIATSNKLVSDEGAFHNAVQIFVEKGWKYFFANYDEIPWLGRQHPPLPVLITGYLNPLFGGNINASRLIANTLGWATAFCTYLIAKQIFNQRIALFSLILLLAITRFYLFHILSGNDIYVTFFFTLTVLILLKLNTLKFKLTYQQMAWAGLAGITLSLGILSKYTMVLIYPLIPAMLIWPFTNQFPKVDPQPRFLEKIRFGMPILLTTILFSLPLLTVWFWHCYQSGYLEQNAVVISRYAGVNSWQNADTIEISTSNYFARGRINFFFKAIFRRIPIAIGMHNLPLIGLALWCWIKGKGEHAHIRNNRFVAFWMAVIFIPVLLTLPVDRYFMPAFPALAILMAYGLNAIKVNPIRILLLALIFSISSATIFLW